MSWVDTALDLVASGNPVVRITLVEVQGSAPRDAGTSMLVWEASQSGTIGGGELEYRLIHAARQMLAMSQIQAELVDYPLGPVLGQCCGGFVRAFLEPLDRKKLDICQAAFTEERAINTKLASGNKSLTDTNSAQAPVILTGKNGDLLPRLSPINDIEELIEQPPVHPGPVYIFGAGHIGAALHQILMGLDLPVRLYDLRPAYCPPETTGQDLLQAATSAPANARFVILTHSHDLDYTLCLGVLSRPVVRYCGLIGSKTKRARFIKRLRDDGIPDAQIKRLTCPAGLPDIGNKHPGEIAIAIAAQLLERKRAPDGN